MKKHLGVPLAFVAAALVVFLLYKGVSWSVIIGLGVVIYAVIFLLSWRKRRPAEPPAPEISNPEPKDERSL